MYLLEFSIYPMDRAGSLGPYVARCIDLVERSGLEYQTHAMGTLVEGDLPDLLQIMQKCFDELAKDSGRITCTAKIEYRDGASGRIEGKVKSVEQALGRSVKK